MQDTVLKLLSARKGHFLLESGHHGNLWLDLESLCLRPRRVQPLANELADSISTLEVEAVCGPLVEGSFVGLLTALHLEVDFIYSERLARPSPNGLFPAGYRVPATLRDGLRGKRVAIVNDVINAGSAMRGTYADLKDCGANVIAIAALLVLGTAASEFTSSVAVPLISLATMPNPLWTSFECPLCASSLPLQDPGNFARQHDSR